jgi:hypothetical protein
MVNVDRPPVVLPDDILNMILDLIGDDKPILAKCMRSFLQLNLLVIPRLYTHIQWGDILSFPLTSSPLYPRLIGPRLSPTKTEILQLVRTFHLQDHTSEDCPAVRGDLTHIDVLRYSACHRFVGAKSGLYGLLLNHNRASDSKCRILAGMAPKKLIIDDTSNVDPVPTRSFNYCQLAKIVVNIWLSRSMWTPYNHSPAQSGTPPRPFGTSPVSTKSLIVLINIIGKTDADPGLKREQDSFCSTLGALVYRPNFASTVLFVNATGLDRNQDGHVISRTPQDIAKLQSKLLADLAAQFQLVKNYWEGGQQGGVAAWKTLLEAQATKVMFIDIQEYLRDYDTTGEFTDEERAIWKSVRAADE